MGHDPGAQLGDGIGGGPVRGALLHQHGEGPHHQGERQQAQQQGSRLGELAVHQELGTEVADNQGRDDHAGSLDQAQGGGACHVHACRPYLAHQARVQRCP